MVIQITKLLTATAIATAASVSFAFADPCEAPLPKRGQHFDGEVRYIVDGDGLCVGKTADPKEWIEVRLADFYAPELREPGGQAAKLALDKIAMGKRVQCVAGRRSYDRTVARCKVEGFAIGDVMRRAGAPEGGRR